MVLSRVQLAIVAVIAAGMLWIEHDDRIVIGTPAVAEATPPAASVCPENEDAPFSADCLAFIDGGAPAAIRPPANTAEAVPAASPEVHAGARLQTPACPPSNEDAPYSADCIKFLSGWYWQPGSMENAR